MVKWIGCFLACGALALAACAKDRDDDRPGPGKPGLPRDWDAAIADNASSLLERGRQIYRHDTFGSEHFWGGRLRLHDAIRGAARGGVGPGLTARQALQLGLRVDVDLLDRDLTRTLLRREERDLDSVDLTLALLRAGAVVGLEGVFDGEQLIGVGVTCSLCHTTVDDALLPGVGRRRDGWPNRDLDIGRIVSLAPDLSPFEQVLGVPRATVVDVLLSWGPGKYDSQLLLDGKAFRPDGRSSAVVIPAAYGMAGQNLHTYTGFGSVPYWNAYVANTQMHGLGTFFDRRLDDPVKYPLVPRTGYSNKRDPIDLVTGKLEALHLYQLAIPPPEAPAGSYEAEAARAGAAIFAGKARCGTCHVPPLFSEPGYPMHTGAEIGIDDFQASRSPDGMYRTTPLRGLFTRARPGYYHDGRFPTLDAVVDHYEGVLGVTLTPDEQQQLVEYLRSL